MSELDYDQRVEAGVREVCELARSIETDEAEEFFYAIAYTATDRFRRINEEKTAFLKQSQSAPRQEGK